MWWLSTAGTPYLSPTACPSCHASTPQAGRDVHDLGEALYGFFLRYSEEFDYQADAVSIRAGGVVAKGTLPFAMDSARMAASTQALYDGAVSWNERLCVDCPLSGGCWLGAGKGRG